MNNILFVAVLCILIAFTGCSSNFESSAPAHKAPQEMIIDKKIVVYDFWAPWCPPCRAFGPTFDTWKTKYSTPNVEFKKINIDEDQEMAVKFKISSIPTVVVYDLLNKKELRKFVGIPKESDILPLIKKD